MPNYILLEKITVGAAGATEITFSSIPQTGYTDLKVVVSARDNNGSNWGGGYIRFNGDTTSGNYNGRQLFGNGSSASSASGSGSWGTNYMLGGRANGGTSTTNTFGNSEFYIPNYTSGNFKSILVDDATETNATAALSEIVSGVWLSTAAITSITVLTPGATYQQGSTFYLYGISKLGTTPTIYPKATGGSIVETDGTYWYHAFLSSGTFTPTTALSCDVLVVAGGGGGGGNGTTGVYYLAAGGGAGGVLAYSNQGLTTTGYTVTIGAGGSAGVNTTPGTNGGNSQFGALTAALGGGWGASVTNTGVGGTYKGATGGSGGGSMNQSGGQTGGLGTAGQGNNGGAGTYSGGGGGGAGGAGANSAYPTNNYDAGAGGAGTNSVTNWGSLSAVLTATGTGVGGYIAGGGGGGFSVAYGTPTTYANGGSGGGGVGGAASAGNSRAQATGAGVANTGGGGGGGGANGNAGGETQGAAGGSGLVIVRYAV